MKVDFVTANEESKIILDMNGIPYSESSDGLSVEFPENVQVSSDQDEFSQPSYYCYQVGDYKYVYPTDTQTLCIE